MIHYQIRAVKALLLFAFCSFLFTACDKDAHESERGMAVATEWVDADDAVTEVSGIHVWIYGKEGALAEERNYASHSELAAALIPLEAGDYTVVTAVNLAEPLKAEQTGSLGTLVLTWAKAQASASPAHVWYGTTEVTVPANAPVRAVTPLNRMLAEVTFVIEEVPAGMKLDAKVLNAATGFLSGVKRSDGKYGVPASGTETEVVFPQAVAEGATVKTATLRLMPTEGAAEKSKFRLTMTHTDGAVQTSEVTADKIMPGGKYIVPLKYGEVAPRVEIGLIDVEDWTDGGSIGGGEAEEVM